MTVNPFNTVGLSVMFILFAVLILWSIIGARGWWWLKVPVIAGTLYFGLAVWYSVDSHLGWATYHDPPRKFMVEWMVVDEPDKVTGDPGSIHILLTKVDHPEDMDGITWKDQYLTIIGYRGNDEEPRLFVRPYSRGLHQAASQVAQMRRAKKKVVGEFKNGKFGAEGEGDGQGRGEGRGRATLNAVPDGAGDGRGYGGDNQGLGDFMFYELPTPNYPPKDR